MTQNGRSTRGQFTAGNKIALAKLPVEYKLIRDAIKSAIHAAAYGVTLTIDESIKYYSREDATVLDMLFGQAIKEKNWAVLEKFFDRIIGPSMQVNLEAFENNEKSLEISKDQKLLALKAAQESLNEK